MIYTALSGMNAAMDRQRAVASNLANASTPGFRQDAFATTAATLRNGAFEARRPVQGSVRGVDLAPGRVVTTGNPLDVAVSGTAMLVLQDRQGGEVYSRRGDLRVGATGVLENGDGLPVLGEAGPITVPLDSSITIAADGSVLAAGAGSAGEAQLIARIRMASVEGSALAKDMDGFLRVPNGGVLPTDPTARLTSGALESSNVETTETLVAMIEAQRAFEQRTKIVSIAAELDEAGSRLMSL
jgi:flagellar basal-body rod protein FlgF